MLHCWRKKAYGEYRKTRESMKERLTAKANVDRILNMEEKQKQEQKTVGLLPG